MGDNAEPQSAAEPQRSFGRHFTDPRLAESVCALALERLAPLEPGRPFRVLDPAAGEGAFLEGAFCALLDRVRGGAPRPSAVDFVGWEIDPIPARRAGERLSRLLRRGAPFACQARIEARDALRPEARAEARGAFDLAAGNPPFVESAAMAAGGPFDRAAIASRFETARGNFDLFVPFVQLAIEALRPGGAAGLIVPNKALAAPYAQALRRWCARHARLAALADLSRGHGFAAGIYPVAAIFGIPPDSRGADQPGAPVGLYEWSAGPGAMRWMRDAPALAERRCEERGWPWSWIVHPLAAAFERALGGAPALGQRARIRGSATVSEAYAWRQAVDDAGPGASGMWPFLTSGAIRPFRALWGEAPARYLGRRYERPVLRLEHPAVSPGRRELARGEKLLLSGMALRPTAYWDVAGEAAGAKSVAAIPKGPAALGPLAAWLASSAASQAYRALFGALSFRGGYLRFGPPQLRALPAPEWERTDARRLERLAREAARLGRIGAAAATAARVARIEALIGQIDEAIEHALGFEAGEREELRRRAAGPGPGGAWR